MEEVERDRGERFDTMPLRLLDLGDALGEVLGLVGTRSSSASSTHVQSCMILSPMRKVHMHMRSCKDKCDCANNNAACKCEKLKTCNEVNEERKKQNKTLKLKS